MRSATLWSVILAASLAACGGDAGSDKPAGDDDDTTKGTDDVTSGDGDGDGEADPGDGADAPLCPLATSAGLPPYDGVKTWSGDDFLACRDACPNFDDPCIAANCPPGFETFNTCVGTEINACMTAQGGPCRDEFESHACCASDNCDLSDPAAGDCVATECADTKQAFLDCGKATGIPTCIETAVPLCISAPATDPGTSGGATEGTGTTIPNELVQKLMLGRSSWGSPAAQNAANGSSL
jgi:hypothetical protein